MSALQEILEKGYVDPMLLDQLGDEQKQILFIKMREEQLRKWHLYEAEMEEKAAKEMKNDKKINGPRVHWLMAVDGKEWVWVMGEHSEDQSIEQILEKESREKARHLAEKEIITLCRAENLPNSLEYGEESLKDELNRMKLNTTDEVPTAKINENEEIEVVSNKFIPDSTEPRDELYDNLDHALFFPTLIQPCEFNGKISRQFRHFPVKKDLVEGPNPPPVPEKPAYLRRTMSKSVENDHLINNKKNLANALPPTDFNTIRSYIPDSELTKRQSKILEQLNERRKRMAQEAEEEARLEQTHWEEQERRAREADESIRKIAQKAREQHRKLLRTSDSLLPLFQMNGSTHSVREALKSLPRPPKPKSRQSIIQWFHNSELSQFNGSNPPHWFHGIISRQYAERLLEGTSVGSFLVRVTEKIFGYTVSYKSDDGIKNYLIERIPEGYQFMGTNQIVHRDLEALIDYHKTVPITAKGGELLRIAQGQQEQPPDYAALFSK